MAHRRKAATSILFAILLWCTCPMASFAQVDSTHQWFVRGNYHYGILLPEYSVMNYTSNDYIRGFEVNFIHQTTGKNIWERLYRNPVYGVSFFYSTMGNKEVYGDQYTLYPFYGLHFIQRPRFTFGYQMGVGISYATKKFSLTGNPENVTIGSHINIHYHADLLARFALTDRLSVNTGIAFNHISNANLAEPNVGLNFVTANVGMQYAYGKKVKVQRDKPERLNPFWTYELTLAGGLKHTRTFESFKYAAIAVGGTVKRRISHRFALGGGLDFFYDSSIEPQMEELNKPFKSQYAYMSGIHLSQEFIYNKVSFILQEGIYVGLMHRLNEYPMYNRAMVRYKFSKHFLMSVSMKSHIYILDFPELGIGYCW